MKPVYLIDCSIYIFRYYFSERPSHLSKSDHEVSTVLAFSQWLLQFLKKEKPEYVACFFDESLTTCFRNDIDKNYKSNRTLPDESLAYELLACKKVAELLGIPCYASERFEADDLIAAVSRYSYEQNLEPVFITRDKDIGQLLQPDGGLFWDYGYDDAIGYDRFSREFGIAPKHIADYLAIAGDNADAIVGVKGVGKKTVAALFEYADGWQDLKSRLDSISRMPIRGAASVERKITESNALIEHNLKLTRLDDRCISDADILVEKREKEDELLELLFSEFNASAAMMEKIQSL